MNKLYETVLIKLGYLITKHYNCGFYGQKFTFTIIDFLIKGILLCL